MTYIVVIFSHNFLFIAFRDYGHRVRFTAIFRLKLCYFYISWFLRPEFLFEDLTIVLLGSASYLTHTFLKVVIQKANLFLTNCLPTFAICHVMSDKFECLTNILNMPHTRNLVKMLFAPVWFVFVEKYI